MALQCVGLKSRDRDFYSPHGGVSRKLRRLIRLASCRRNLWHENELFLGSVEPME